MFDPDRFISDCDTAVSAGGGAEAIHELLQEAIRDPGAIMAALGEPRRAGPQFLHRSSHLTVMNLIWTPSFTQTVCSGRKLASMPGVKTTSSGGVRRRIVGLSPRLALRRCASVIAYRWTLGSFTRSPTRSTS